MIEDVFACMERINEIRKRFAIVKQEAKSNANATSFEAELKNATAQKPISKKDIDTMIENVSLKEGVSPNLVKAMVQNESNYNYRAVSPKGAVGLMQLMPDTAGELGVKNPLEVEQNITGGVKYIKELLQKYDGDYRKAVAAYNAGPKTVDQYGGVPPYAETKNYVDGVMKSFGQLDAADDTEE